LKVQEALRLRRGTAARSIGRYLKWQRHTEARLLVGEWKCSWLSEKRHKSANEITLKVQGLCRVARVSVGYAKQQLAGCVSTWQQQQHAALQKRFMALEAWKHAHLSMESTKIEDLQLTVRTKVQQLRGAGLLLRLVLATRRVADLNSVTMQSVSHWHIQCRAAQQGAQQRVQQLTQQLIQRRVVQVARCFPAQVDHRHFLDLLLERWQMRSELQRVKTTSWGTLMWAVVSAAWKDDRRCIQLYLERWWAAAMAARTAEDTLYAVMGMQRIQHGTEAAYRCVLLVTLLQTQRRSLELAVECWHASQLNYSRIRTAVAQVPALSLPEAVTDEPACHVTIIEGARCETPQGRHCIATPRAGLLHKYKIKHAQHDTVGRARAHNARSKMLEDVEPVMMDTDEEVPSAAMRGGVLETNVEVPSADMRGIRDEKPKPKPSFKPHNEAQRTQGGGCLDQPGSLFGRYPRETLEGDDCTVM